MIILQWASAPTSLSLLILREVLNSVVYIYYPHYEVQCIKSLVAHDALSDSHTGQQFMACGVYGMFLQSGGTVDQFGPL